MDLSAYGDDPAVQAHVLGTAYAQSPIALACTKASPFYNTLQFFKGIPEDKFVACFRTWLTAVVKTYKVESADDAKSINYDKLNAILNPFEDILSLECSKLLVSEWKHLLETSNTVKPNSYLLKTFDESMHFKFGALLA
jgi:hypothetical protein